MERNPTTFYPAEADPLYLLRLLARRWWLLILAALTAVLLVLTARTLFVPETYTAELTFAATAENNNTSTTVEAAAVYARVLQSELMADAVCSTLGSVPGSIRATRLDSTNLIGVTVSAETQQDAWLMAQAVLEHYEAVCRYVSTATAITALDGHSVTAQSSRSEASLFLYIIAAAIGALVMGALVLMRRLRQGNEPAADDADHSQAGLMQEDLVHIDPLALVRHMLPQLRRAWALIVLPAVVLSACLYWHAAATHTTLYQSEAIFSVGVRRGAEADILSYDHYYDSRTANYLAQTLPHLLNSRLGRELLCQALGTAEVDGTVTVESIAQTNHFALTVTAPDAREACRILKAALEVCPRMIREVMGDVQLRILREPDVADRPCNRLPWAQPVLLGAVLGALPGCALAVVGALRSSAVQPYRRKERAVKR